jgi:CelD/BcsL family acetyltransferase involved in cellulose biosynthesis
LRTIDYIETGWVDVRGSFDNYWKSRGKHLQQNMRTQRTRLAREGINASLEVATHPELVAAAIVDFGRLETAGWKGAAGTALHTDNNQGKFYRAAMTDFCRIGAGRIYRYRFGDRVVAVDLCVESSDVQVLLKTTHDGSFRGLSPSSLMRQEAYRQIFEEGRLRRIEFYGRVMEWTMRWTDTKRTLYHVNSYRNRMVPVAVSQLANLRLALPRRTLSSAANE